MKSYIKATEQYFFCGTTFCCTRWLSDLYCQYIGEHVFGAIIFFISH